MKFKKLGSIILAGAMALSLAVPAFAAGTTGKWDKDSDDRLAVSRATEFEIEMTGEVYTPVIRVQVASKGAKMYLNTNKGDIAGEITGFSEGTDETAIGYKFQGLGVASTPIMIRSDSDDAISVNANVTVTHPTGVEIAAASTSSVTDKKSVYIQVAGTTHEGSSAITDAASVANMTEAHFTAASSTKGGVIAETSTAGTATANAQGVATIASAKMDDGKITPQYGAVMLTGSCSKPTGAAGSWSADDALSATVILTFSGVAA